MALEKTVLDLKRILGCKTTEGSSLPFEVQSKVLSSSIHTTESMPNWKFFQISICRFDPLQLAAVIDKYEARTDQPDSRKQPSGIPHSRRGGRKWSKRVMSQRETT